MVAAAAGSGAPQDGAAREDAGEGLVREGLALPGTVLAWLDGGDLARKCSTAFPLITVDAGGWPHEAMLSAGEVLLSPDRVLRVVLYAGSGTAANLRRNGRCTLMLPADSGICEIRACVAEYAGDRLAAPTAALEPVADPLSGDSVSPLAVFVGVIARVRHHVSPYADVTGGMSFALHDPDAVLARWRKQIDMLRALRVDAHVDALRHGAQRAS